MPEVLARLKAATASDPAAKSAYAALLRAADAAARGPLYTVTDKTAVPPSGDRHDYLSLAPYWWPNPSKPDGKPYLRRDGEINPERSTDRYDVTDLDRMSRDVEVLSLAYYFSGEARYADRAAKLMRTWFIDPRTRMNPNMNFAQAVPGREDGRKEGVIDTTRLQRVVEGIGLIAPSGMLTKAEQAGLEKWFGDYVDWMMTSKNGKAEDAARNNHALWYDAQLVHFSLFARRPDIARKVIHAFPERRIAPQLTPEGALPEELARTRSLHYSIYALLAAYDVAELGRCVGSDLWNYEAGGKSLKRATDFVAAYRGRIGDWPYREIRPEEEELDELLRRASAAWPSAVYPVQVSAEMRRFFGHGPALGEGRERAAD
ncbi:alginate lyase family protein [Sphingomonas sp. S2-65]|uniref:alginate lyase family protein n=1 Tax=Sphingomonas sp. S2-65 TaxID=2903960 RepID=UPI001F39D393|nr:alginate lyase family protein [Sphingomonas sp. S2-65]UYY60058.1 alginate lyase family protein [Sphingomonas sp. S2-65]